MRRLSIVLISLLSMTAGAGFAFQEETIRSLLEAGKPKEARALLEPVLESNPRDHEAHYYLGIVELAEGHGKAAIRHLERAVKLHGEDSRYHFQLAQAYGLRMSETGKFSQMRLAPKYRKQLERTLELDPKHVKARIGLCNYCLQAPEIFGGGTKKAMQHAQVLLAQDERQGRLLLARIYAKEGNPGKAEAEYRALVEKHGEDESFYQLYNAYGYFLLGQGRTEEAIAAFEKQVELAPGQANPHDSLGEALESAGRLKEALASYRRALEIDPDLPSARKAVTRLEKKLPPGVQSRHEVSDSFHRG